MKAVALVALLAPVLALAEAPPPPLQVGFLVAVVRDSALQELGLRPTGVDGLALPADRESGVLYSMRLLSLQEQGLARVVATPAMLLQRGSAGRITSSGAARPVEIRASTVDVGGEPLLDVSLAGGPLARDVVLRARGPVGSFALLGESGHGHETVVVLVTSRVDAPPAEATSAEETELLRP